MPRAATNTIDKGVGERIRARRNELKLTQSALARAIGVTFQQVQKYEKGSNRIGAGRLYQIAAYLGVTPLYFFEGLGIEPDAPAGRPSGAAISPEEMRQAATIFSSIADPGTRASVLALMRSLAEPAGREPVGVRD